MDRLILGQYIPGNSLIHRLDPRTKLISSIWFIILIFLASGFWSYALLASIVLIAASISEIPISYYINGLKPLTFLILITVSLQLLFSQGETILIEWGWLQISLEGVVNALKIIVRFVLIIFMSTILTLTTTPLEIADGIEALLKPLKSLKIPVEEIALVLSIALRFVPTLMEETEKIMNAQKSRGVEFNVGSLIERMKKIVPLLIPLFISSIDRADQLATAMTARGYRGGDHRTKLRELNWEQRDYLIFTLFVFLTLLLIII
ncbi:MAG: energy-coupling factor transporter transmembrane protein EcfT [Atopostipes suicloacalis]|nr:energy-coupling factor transporter transmembrane protein EcfT [Atopostipes suicloacalis]MDN6731634.1 energy-coupling factor transporter transmembrane protein EcfT [Atopostipes suicloacalis]